MKYPLVVLTGPTAVGKTKLSIALAKAINGEIISADSMQVYKYMDIGSAKIMPQEMDGIKHYLVDCIEPTDEFNVTIFQRMAKDAIAEIVAKGKIPIIVGGTGFYIQSVLYDIDFTKEDGDRAYREALEALEHIHGADYLHAMLREVDEEASKQIHANNVKRVIRALEFYKQTGTKISEHNEKQSQKQSPYESYYFVLNDNRERLYERIDHRVDIMFEQGLVAEVQALMDMGCTKELVSMQGLGYKEVIEYLEGTITIEEANYIVKRDTRHFAKRQLTWFRRERDVIFLNKEELLCDEEILQKMLEIMKKVD